VDNRKIILAAQGTKVKTKEDKVTKDDPGGQETRTTAAAASGGERKP